MRLRRIIDLNIKDCKCFQKKTFMTLGLTRHKKHITIKKKKIGLQNKALLLPKVTTKKIHRQATNGGKMLQYINLTKD